MKAVEGFNYSMAAEQTGAELPQWTVCEAIVHQQRTSERL